MFRFTKSAVRNRRRHRVGEFVTPVPACERLEDRQMLATFGTPWPDARNLSVSFPTDQSTIGAYANSLRTVLDQVADRQDWQETALRAFQTWAVQANINIGLVPDRGDTFGTPGLGVNDPRFGELRLGAFPQPGVLASALPYQQIAGTWSGDVLLNTQTNWFLGDWESGSPISVPAPNEKGPAVELFSVLLHEAGNALSLADNTTRGTVMYTDYLGPRGALTQTDIAAIRRIYGARRDIYETVSNNTRGRATRIVHPTGYNGQTPLSVRASLNTMNDVDFYRFRPLAGREKVTVRLQAAGISLLKAQLEVLDSAGVKIADVKADSIFENNLQLEIGSLNPGRDYFIRVVRNSSDVFGIGDYRIDLDYRDPSQQPSILAPVYDADAEDEDDDVVEYLSVDDLFSQGLVSMEVQTNDTLTTATVLETSPGYLQSTRFEAQASLSSATDRDFFRFQAPSLVSEVLNIDVDPVGMLQPAMDIVVMNAAGDRVPSRLLEKAGSGRSVQILNPTANATYVIGVQTLATSETRTGNYLLAVDFSTEAAGMTDMFSGEVAGIQSDFSNLQSRKSQLFRFDLSATATTTDQGIQLSIFNARTRDLVFTFSVGAGITTTEYLWLPKGEYVVKADARTRSGPVSGSVGYRLRADVLSDDQGPNPVDPTQVLPPIQDPWIWTDYPPTSPPTLSLPPTLIDDPWMDERTLDYLADYYTTYYG